MKTRIDILNRAAELTGGDRQKAYGSPRPNMQAHAELLQWYRRWAEDRYSPEHDAAIVQVLAKLARIAVGQFKDDNYVDGAAYLGIAFECEQEYRDGLKPISDPFSPQAEAEQPSLFPKIDHAHHYTISGKTVICTCQLPGHSSSPETHLKQCPVYKAWAKVNP